VLAPPVYWGRPDTSLRSEIFSPDTPHGRRRESSPTGVEDGLAGHGPGSYLAMKRPISRSGERRETRRPAVVWLAATTILALFLSGCGVATTRGMLSQPPDEVGEGEVGMQVFGDRTGSALALVPVSFGNSGPFQFVLDTGASRTVIDSGLVEELGLAKGMPTVGTGVASSLQGSLVEVEEWRVGDVELQSRTVVAAELPEAPQGPEFRGLLGSDVLAGFGSVRIDYESKVLTLPAGE
jgi:hypothetical protein